MVPLDSQSPGSGEVLLSPGPQPERRPSSLTQPTDRLWKNTRRLTLSYLHLTSMEEHKLVNTLTSAFGSPGMNTGRFTFPHLHLEALG